jgi:hypothetical protein
MRRAQPCARVDPAILAAQPFAVDQMGAGERGKNPAGRWEPRLVATTMLANPPICTSRFRMWRGPSWFRHLRAGGLHLRVDGRRHDEMLVLDFRFVAYTAVFRAGI